MITVIQRKIESNLREALARGKSVLLLGPRQTGKTTMIEQSIKPDIAYSFARIQTRQRYERHPELLEQELEERVKTLQKPPIVFIDEVQKVPEIMDVAQNLIDHQQAQFIFTGSSAHKLKHGGELNLLPGRVVVLSMTPLLIDELPDPKPTLDEILLYGTLPGIIREPSLEHRDSDLLSYVQTYLEEEIRAEAFVRNVGSFSRFLELAAGESGKTVNYTALSQAIGVSSATIQGYFQILEDCLIVTRIDPMSDAQTKRRLIKSPQYLFFDLGVRRACANEGTRLPLSTLGSLFEQFVGNELLHQSQLHAPYMKVRYWRDAAGPEVDFVLEGGQQLIPIEVKWSDQPKLSDARHLKIFMAEHPTAKQGYIVCRTPHRYQIEDNILALPWEELCSIVENIER